ncbi:uroplakin-3b [Athene noctua]|uniref:uroplakin-3b n=1 Tax=Athene noctua TaxID=126797 RepID=UPI003EB939E3
MELPRVLLALAGTGAAAGLALLPYVPRVPPAALPGKITATTFALERPCCVFDRHANASDAVWLVVAFANASAAFRNPPSRADVPSYEQLPTACSYMTLETAAAAYACSAPSSPVLRVGGDTACGGQGGRDPCNGPLPSPGPYRVKFLVMGCHGPKAETRWSDPILLRRAGSPSTIDPAPARRSSDVVVVASILASLGAVLAAAVLGAVGRRATSPRRPPRTPAWCPVHQAPAAGLTGLELWRTRAPGPPKTTRDLGLVALGGRGGHMLSPVGSVGSPEVRSTRG